MKVCQSCGMNMNEKSYGTDKNENKTEEYCCYCYQDGKFLKEETVEEMIESCIPFRMNNTDCTTVEETRKKLLEIIPNLKRWI